MRALLTERKGAQEGPPPPPRLGSADEYSGDREESVLSVAAAPVGQKEGGGGEQWEREGGTRARSREARGSERIRPLSSTGDSGSEGGQE